MGGNASYPCVYCTWKSSSPLDEKGEDRSVDQCVEQFNILTTVYDGNSKDFSKKCFGVESIPAILRDPWELLVLPTLHLRLLVNNIHKFIYDIASEEEKSQYLDDLSNHHILVQKYHGGSLNGTGCRKLLLLVATNKLILPSSSAHLTSVLTAFNAVVSSLFGTELHLNGNSKEEIIKEFVTQWKRSGLTHPLKAHIIACHVIPAIEQLPEGWGLGGWSEQACESAHAAFKVVMERMNGEGKLVRGVEEFNYYRMFPKEIV